MKYIDDWKQKHPDADYAPYDDECLGYIYGHEKTGCCKEDPETEDCKKCWNREM